MKTSEYKRYDGLGLAELVRKKEVKPIELVDAAIQVIEKENPTLNAIIHKRYEQAKQQAREQWTGPFAGVPFVLKDITQEIKGEPLTSGSKALQNYRASEDSNYVKRIKVSGVIILGQTNVPEFALMGITEPKHYGPTRNPWNQKVTPGGSSGGSASAVASGMVPIAGANDGGGSIRIPAAYTGLFGLKPTRGRTPVGPKFGRHWQGASAEHILSKTVRDSAAMLDVLKTYEKGAAFHALPYDQDYLSIIQTQNSDKRYRFAFSLTSPLGTEVDEECKHGVLKTVKLLESMGHIVEEKEPSIDGSKLAASYLTLYFGEVAASIQELSPVLGRQPKYKDVEPTTWLLGLLGNSVSAKDFVLSIREWDVAAYKMEQFHEEYDFFITPTTAFLPSQIGEQDITAMEKLLISLTSKLKLAGVLKRVGMVDQIAKASLKRTPFTQLANLTGQPAMSVPLHITEAGLPVGVQFMAARGREDLLLELATCLEQTDNWIGILENPYMKE